MKCLFLSHWKDVMEVRVESNLLQNMKNHHFLGARFLYNAYKKKFKGVILNYEQGMNYPWILQIFLSALFKYQEMKSPVLILSPQHDIYTWHYHLKQIGVELILLNDKNCKEVFQNCDASIILASLSDLNIVYPHRDKKFEFVIVDQFDSVAYKKIFKKLSGNFNIALTNKDFMVERNQKLLWTMLNWTNPLLFGKLTDFYKKDNEHLENLRDPYDEVWHRLSWNFCESFVKETEEELEAYKKVIDDWKAANKMDKFETSPQQKAAKRKSQKPEKNGKNSKAKTKKRQDHSSLATAKIKKTTNADEESQSSFDSSFVNKNGRTHSRSLKNYSKLPTISENIRTKNQILKSASKAERQSNFKREYSELIYTEILKSFTEKKSTEKLESSINETQKNLSEDDGNNKKVNNKSLLIEADVLQEPEQLKCDCHSNNKETKSKSCSTHHEDKVTQTDLPTLEEMTNNCADNAKLHVEKDITSNGSNGDEAIPLVTEIIEDSQLTAGQCGENSNANTSSDAEESDILLSIIEGKFSASQEEFNMLSEKKKGIASSSIDENSTTKFPKSNSENILASLFGTEAEHVENLEAPKQKVQFVESLNQENSYSQLFLSDCLSPVKCASEEYRFPKISNNSTIIRKSNYETHVLESLFNFNEDVGDYKSLKKNTYKLSDEERNTLITSLFGDQIVL